MASNKSLNIPSHKYAKRYLLAQTIQTLWASRSSPFKYRQIEANS